MGQFELTFVIDRLQSETVAAIYDEYEAMYSEHGSMCLLTVIVDGATAFVAAKKAIHVLDGQHRINFHRAYEDLVTKADIADRAGTTIQAVGQWVRGLRHRGVPFPQPYNNVAGGVWLWAEVNRWLALVGKGHDEDVDYPVARDLTRINSWLASRTESPPLGHANVAWTHFSSKVAFVENPPGHARAHETPQKWTRSDYEIVG
ncbi:hypothetical protein [Amycolatopsis magusensis]|uniref:hypothetical protein n=1 Tax=Amycolatopsis magusensis TaxID=882444 RepID=UPI0037BBDA33